MNIIQAILNLFFGGNKKKEVKELDKQIKVKDNEVKELEKEVKVLESKKRVNKKEVAKLKRKVTTTKKQIAQASEAVKEDNADARIRNEDKVFLKDALINREIKNGAEKRDKVENEEEKNLKTNNREGNLEAAKQEWLENTIAAALAQI